MIFIEVFLGAVAHESSLGNDWELGVSVPSFCCKDIVKIEEGALS